MDGLNSRELAVLAEHGKPTTRTNHLLCNHHNSLCGEPSVAVIEEIFKGGTEQVDDENVV